MAYHWNTCTVSLLVRLLCSSLYFVVAVYLVTGVGVLSIMTSTHPDLTPPPNLSYPYKLVELGGAAILYGVTKFKEI